jgi:hypothetical protein
MVFPHITAQTAYQILSLITDEDLHLMGFPHGMRPENFIMNSDSVLVTSIGDKPKLSN